MRARHSCTHRKPEAKVTVVSCFLRRDIFNFQIDGIGRIRIAKSVITLKAPPVLKKMSPL